MNAFWERVQEFLEPDPLDPEGTPVADQFGMRYLRSGRPEMLKLRDPLDTRIGLIRDFSFTITDPATVDFVAAHCLGTVVDPMAGSGWWAHLLRERGIDVVAADTDPGGFNRQHIDDMIIRDGAEVLADSDAETMLLSWPDMDRDTGERMRAAFTGKRIIYIGEWGGCCGSPELFDGIAAHGIAVAAHKPVQWYGLHDLVLVFDVAEMI